MADILQTIFSKALFGLIYLYFVSNLTHFFLSLVNWQVKSTLVKVMQAPSHHHYLTQRGYNSPTLMRNQVLINSSPPGQYGRQFDRRPFSNAFPWMKMIEFRFNLHWIFPQDSNWQYASIGSGHGLAPNRRQAITWTNDDPVHWRIYASLGRNELTHWSRVTHICVNN